MVAPARKQPVDNIGESIRLIRGDCMTVLPTLPDDSIDAIITDPPYSSGGMTRGDRANQSTSAKYVQTQSVRFGSADFSGDNRDQRSWGYWCSLWLGECLRVARPGGYLLMFTDWRQLPMATDSVQAGGWVWRGIIPWDKGPAARAAAPHYFRHQCEYVVWATRGPCEKLENWPPAGEGCYPGLYSHPVRQDDKHHMVGKPTPLLRDLMRIVPPGATVMDPFMGSGTTGVAALLERRNFLGIEVDEGHYQTALSRMEKANGAGSLFEGRD